MKHLILGLLVSVSVFLVSPVMAAGDATAGKQKSESCVLCHGEAGKGGTPGFPVLAGQHADYLVQALEKYKSGDRQNPMMAGVAAGLSEQDMLDLGAYFSSQTGLKVLKR